MISLSQSRPAVSDENEQALRIYRSLAVTGAAVLPGFGIVRRLVDPHSHDPIFERVSIALILLVFVVLSLVNGPVRRHPHQSIAVVIYLVSAGVIHIGAINGLSTNTAFGYLIMLFACSLVFRTRAMLAGYQITTIATVGLMVWLAPQLTIDPKFFMFSLVAVALLTFAVQANRLAAEAALREARDLAETAVEVRSRFLANVSHEIRTPMNGVVGMVSLLEDTELSVTQRDYLRTIRTSSDSLLLLINDILDFSKLEAGYVELESAAFDLVACVEDAAEVVAPAAREKGLELLCECAPAVPARVIGDSLRLRQVLVNLLSNAVKFTPRGEVLVYLWGRPEGARGWRARCTVRDTGIGIDAGCVDGLFEAFAQADSSTTRRFGGTGLGLSISLEDAHLHGGWLQAWGRPNQGAQFRLTLPRYAGAALRHSPLPLVPADARDTLEAS
jgi:signal transduction histidine kinase